MKQKRCYENYPMWMVLLSNLVSFMTYFCGAAIMYMVGKIWLCLYLLFIAWLELKLLKGHCVDCYYYGKYCAFGKGKLSSLFFKKGTPVRFIHMKLTWKDIVPDFLVSMIPAIVGIILMIIDFSWLLLFLVLSLFLLTFIGNALIRSMIACKYCKQREIGCPAEKLFSKTK